MSSNNEIVSVLVASYGRQHLLENLFECFKAQDYPNSELLILDSSPQKAEAIELLCAQDSRVRYLHASHKMSPGPARNYLIEAANGTIFANWDDDDYYAPTYLSTMVRQLEEADFVSLSGWFAWSVESQQLFYWDTKSLSKVHFVVSPNEESDLVNGLLLHKRQFRHRFYGFSQVYRRFILESYRFADVARGYDWEFAQYLVRTGVRLTSVADSKGLCLHVMHRGNASRIFPQYRLPGFLLEQIFGAAVSKYTSISVSVE